MRHRVRGRGLGRSPSHRRAMIRNMVTSLFQAERIETTDAKAKEIRPYAERIITLGKRGDLHSRRRALRFVRRRDVVAKVFSELAERFKDRPGGYTRIIKLGHREGDAAQLSVLELIPSPTKAAPGKRTRRLRRPKGVKEAPPAEAAEVREPEAKKVGAPPSAPGAKAAPKKEEKKAPEKKKAPPKKEAPEKEKARTKPKKEVPEKVSKAKKAEAKEKAPAKKAAPPKKKEEKPPPKTSKGKPKK